jgi:hypothetical protein
MWSKLITSEKKISLYNPQTYIYPGTGESVPLTLRNDYFFVSAKNEMPDRSRID